MTKHDRIPESAEKVFSGVRIAIYQWDQVLYDGSIARFERARFLDGSFAVALLPGGDIIMTEQEQPGKAEPYITLPGGGFDHPFEDPLLCAKRELLEETGYISDEWELWHRAEGTQNIITYTYFYIARNCRLSEEIPPPDPGEKIRVYTVSFDECIHLAENPRFIHWPLLPYFYGALLSKESYQKLQNIFRGSNKI